MRISRPTFRLRLATLGSVSQLPAQCEYIAGGCRKNLGTYGIRGIGRLMEVRMDAAADDSDGGNSGLFEGHMVSTRKEAENVEAVANPGFLPCLFGDSFSQPGHPHSESSVSDPRVIYIEHRDGGGEWHAGVSHVKPRP